MSTAEWAIAAASVDAVWLVALVAGLYVLERQVRELHVWAVSVSVETLSEETDVNSHRETGDPDIGTPPLIPPPYDADSRPD